MTTIFDITLESNNIATEFTSNSGGDVAISSAAALHGTYGLGILINDATDLEARKDAAVCATPCWRLYFDPNSKVMANGDSFSFLYIMQSGGGYSDVVLLSLRKIGTAFNIGCKIANDAGGYSLDDGVDITDAPHYIEVHIVRATNSTSANGSCEWFVDGVSQGTAANIDNYNIMSDTANWRCKLMKMGADAGTYGTAETVYFDDFKMTDDGATIGPVVTGWANIAKVNGIAAASITKINGIAVAGVTKVNGIAV
jgi:hypothetical protein